MSRIDRRPGETPSAPETTASEPVPVARERDASPARTQDAPLAEAPLPAAQKPPARLPDSAEPHAGVAAVAALADHPLFQERPIESPASGPSAGPAPRAPEQEPLEVLEALLGTLPDGSPEKADVHALMAMYREGK